MFISSLSEWLGGGEEPVVASSVCLLSPLSPAPLHRSHSRPEEVKMAWSAGRYDTGTSDGSEGVSS